MIKFLKNLSSISVIIGLYNLLKYIEDNYTKAEFGMLLIFLSTVILIFVIRKNQNSMSTKAKRNVRILWIKRRIVCDKKAKPSLKLKNKLKE